MTMNVHRAKPRLCRACHSAPAIRRGLSVRLCGNCLAKPALQREKPVRPPLPAYKLLRVAQEGVSKPCLDIGKGNVRCRSLLDLAHAIYTCTNCDRHVAHGCEPAHADAGMTESKGLGMKASDAEHAALCGACHKWLDQGGSEFDPSGRYAFTREDRRAMWTAAYFRTQAEYWKRNWLRVA